MKVTTEIQNDPAIKKLLDFAKGKKSISYDEVNDFLPDSIVHSDRIEEVIALLEKHSIKLEDEEINLDLEEEKTVKDRKKLIYSDKESSVDDPIRLYLREIGKENLLTAEQEVELSKRMEEGEGVIRGVIKSSGALSRELLRGLEGPEGRGHVAQGRVSLSHGRSPPRRLRQGTGARRAVRGQASRRDQEAG
jgi:RNA polymerase primary sigma factor